MTRDRRISQLTKPDTVSTTQSIELTADAFAVSLNGSLNGQVRVHPFTTGNPFLGTKLLGFSIGRGSGFQRG